MNAKQERFDAYSGVAADALKVLYKSRVRLYRPNRFRSIVPVAVGTVPEYAQRLEVETATSFADFKPSSQIDEVKPTGTEEIDIDTYRTLKMEGAFMLFDDEIKAYQATGVSPSNRRIVALQTRSEQVLNDIAANGYNGARIKGLLNQDAAASPTEKQVELQTTSLIDFTDAGETAENIYDALVDMVQGFHNRSLEAFDANTILLPTTQLDAAAKLRSSVDNRTAVEMFREVYGNVRLLKWNKCDGIGTNTNGRTVVGSFTPDVLEMLNPYELREDKRIDRHSGIEVGMSFKTAGVVVYEPRGIEYHDHEA